MRKKKMGKEIEIVKEKRSRELVPWAGGGPGGLNLPAPYVPPQEIFKGETIRAAQPNYLPGMWIMYKKSTSTYEKVGLITSIQLTISSVPVVTYFLDNSDSVLDPEVLYEVEIVKKERE